LVKTNYPMKRNGSNRGGRRNAMSDSERDILVERNNGRFRRSTAEMVADFWPLAVVPALLVTYGLLHCFVMQDVLSGRVAVLAGIATAFVLNSLFTVWFYKTDKRQAERQLRRIPEFSLHFWELFCGWPGALYAQKKYHHKWKKTSFMAVFWLYVVLNVAVVLGVAFPELSLPVLRNVNAALKGLFGKG